ncbi:GntR family transcriptional regulator [Litoreibacter albidus]|uniref:GntR family transcriptional regulator n=1 Tax=Litoreibacter albidus TaxID=670155 RepID=UPI00373592A8
MSRSNTKTGRSGRPSFEQSDGHATAAFRREVSRIVLSREASSPLWLQLSDQFENLILSGKLAPESRIPSESALCSIFSVSRPVVRSAISALAARGLVNKLPRKGMFVGKPPRDSSFVTSNVSLFDDMIARGAKIRTRTYELKKCLADEEERAALQLDDDAEVVRVARVFWVDERPITYTNIAFPADKVPGFEKSDLEGQSVLGMISDLYDRQLVRAERWFSATMPTDEVCEKMDITGDKPLIWIESIGYENDGSPLEYYRAFYNSQAARIHVSVAN